MEHSISLCILFSSFETKAVLYTNLSHKMVDVNSALRSNDRKSNCEQVPGHNNCNT